MAGGGRSADDRDVQTVRRLPDSPVTALAFGPITQSFTVAAMNGILMGWAAVENSGAASAAFDILDGTDDNASLLEPVTLTAGQSTSDDFTSWGIWVQRGLRIKMISGSVRGVLYFILPGDAAGR